MGKIIITKQHNRLLLALFDGNKPYLMRTAPLLDEEDILGNIYLAKVKDIVRGIQGAFLSIGTKQAIYLPMDQCRQVLIANREPSKSIQQGDEIVIQVTGEALKSKQPSSSALLTLRGQFCVCNYFGHGLHYSKKLTHGKKELIGSYLENTIIEGREKYHFTVRTNAENLTDFSLLSQEMQSFIRVFDYITDTYKYRTCYTCFYHRETEIINQIKNISLKIYEEIVTDEREVWELLSEEFKDKPVRLYQDDMLSLASLYSINTHLQEALGKRVWLAGGG
ncbi:MAG: ribonuclease E/G [Lachnospiraceae bacterium]|nr:ribonuclease E/G [Lachnospiraceae bacterium]